MGFLDRILHGKKIKKAKRVDSVPVGCYFSIYPKFKSGEFVICPMKSGRDAILRAKVNTPRDPGDQHFYSWDLICYVTEKRKDGGK